jgi:amino acid transporter
MTTGALGKEPPSPDQLSKGSLGTWDAVAMAIAVLSPAMAMAYNTTGVAATAGGSTPLAVLLGGVACLCLAFVVVGFTRRMASAGYAYTYASRSLGQGTGFLTGWLYTFGFFCFVPMTMAGVGGFTRDLIKNEVWSSEPDWMWFIYFLVGMALLIYLAVFGIKLTARTQLVVGAVTVAVIVVLDVIVTAKGGKNGQSLQPFTFGHTLSGGFNGIFYGIILGVTSFIGFESAAVLGEETRNPRRAIPLATIVAVVFAIVFYVWTTYSMAIGFGVNNGAAWAKDPTALATTAQVYSGHTLSILISIAAILSAFVVCLACANAAARTMFAMGREGTLPAVFGRTHPVHKTPVNAILGVTAVATVVAALIGFFWDYGGGPTTVYFLMASIGTIAIILVYMALCLGGVAFFRRLMRKWNPIVHAVLPAIGFIIFGLAVYGSIYPGALPPMPYRIVPYVNLGWLALGIVLLWYLRTNHPQRVSRIGSILGEEGGEEAGALDEAPLGPGGVKPTEPTAGMANPD